MLAITRKLLTNPTSRPALRPRSEYQLRELRALVLHWTANTDRGADALANRNYFNLGTRPASAHYVVDDSNIIQCVPDNEVAFHVGAKRYLPAGVKVMGGMRGGRLTPNYFTIGMEMCVNVDGDWNRTYSNAVDMAAFLMLKYEIPALYRHYDITGKDCPKMMIEAAAWKKCQDDINAAMIALRPRVLWFGKTTTPALPLRLGAGEEHAEIAQFYTGEPVMVFEEVDGWVRVEENGWVARRFVERDLE